MATYTFLTNHNDWEALAIDGEIVDQGHEVNAMDALKSAKGGPEIGSVERLTFKIGPEGVGGYLPDTIEAIRKSEEWRLIE
jgi:hypothetical protein